MTSRPTACPATKPAWRRSPPSWAIPIRNPSRTTCSSICIASKATTPALFEEAPSLAGPDGNLVFTGTDDDPGTLATPAHAWVSAMPAAAAAIVRRWHHGRFRATATARARELLTELMPGLLKALGSTAAPDQALLNFDLFLGNLPAGIQLFSLFKANPALLELVAAIMGSAPGLAAHLARRTILLDSVLSPDFYQPLPPVQEMTADLAAQLASSTTSRTFSTGPVAGPTIGASRWACSSSRRSCGRRRRARLFRHRRRHHFRSVRPHRTALCRTPWRLSRPASGGAGHGQARQPRDVGHLRPRPDLRLRHSARSRGVGRPPAAGADPVLHAAQRQDRDGAHRPDQRGRALRGRHAPASVRPRRAARQFAGRLRELPCAIGLDVGAHGADAGARDPRTGGPGRAPGRHRQEHALPAARSRGTGARRRRHARSHRPPRAAQEPVGLQAPARRPVRYRLRGAVPRACATPPNGPTCSTRIPPRCCGAPPTPDSSTRNDAERLRACRTLLSDVQGLLRLTLDSDESAFDETKAPEGQQRLIAATEGARDLAELRARIAAETAAAPCYIPTHRRGTGARRRLAAARRGRGGDP